MDVGLSMLQGILSPFHRQVGERPGDLEEIPVCYGRLLFHSEGVQSGVFAQSRQHLGSKVAEVVDVSFPLKFLGQSEHVAPFVSSSALTWSESKVITTSCLFTSCLHCQPHISGQFSSTGNERVRSLGSRCVCTLP